MIAVAETISEKPILFSSEMVRAILAGKKTQTRRIVKTDTRPQSADTFMRGFPPDPQNVRFCGMHAKCDAPMGSRSVSYRVLCPYGWLGDRLWVKETWAPNPLAPVGSESERPYLCYRANGDDAAKWKPSIFMRRNQSRLTLEITMLGVERLNDITDADARAEGCCGVTCTQFGLPNYRYVWESINGAGSWARNPFVWKIDFKRV